LRNFLKWKPSEHIASTFFPECCGCPIVEIIFLSSGGVFGAIRLNQRALNLPLTQPNMARLDTGLRLDSGLRLDEPGPPASNPRRPMNQNLISATLTDAQRDAILADLTAAQTKMADSSHSLTPEDRRRLTKIEAADMTLLDQALQFAQQNPGAMPADVDLAALAEDIALGRQYLPICAKANQTAEIAGDNCMSALSDAYVAALDIYRVAKALNTSGQYDAFVQAFGQRFARRSRQQPTPPPAR